jgi:hypothetical protein
MLANISFKKLNREANQSVISYVYSTYIVSSIAA